MYNTDKAELLKEYERLFDTIRNDDVTLLEIGIWEGGSLLWAKDFFPNGNILGIDLNLPVMNEDRIDMFVIDQNNSDGLRDMAKDYGKFDVIIDDGSHLGKETKNCFRVLWPHVKEGGWYVIEDWDAFEVAPQFKAITKMAQNMLKFKCKKKIYFKNNKAYAAFQK